MLVFLFVCQSDYMFRPQRLAPSIYIICLWPDDDLIGAETCSHTDKQIKNQHILVVFWLSILTLIIEVKWGEVKWREGKGREGKWSDDLVWNVCNIIDL